MFPRRSWLGQLSVRFCTNRVVTPTTRVALVQGAPCVVPNFSQWPRSAMNVALLHGSGMNLSCGTVGPRICSVGEVDATIGGLPSPASRYFYQATQSWLHLAL
jgi:hypothetical protein